MTIPTIRQNHCLSRKLMLVVVVVVMVMMATMVLKSLLGMMLLL
jgi:hypothetical protein